jgi:hypothetical protein
MDCSSWRPTHFQNLNGTGSGRIPTRGDQNSVRQRWGRPSFDRTNRFVLSTTYVLPNSYPNSVQRAVFGGWSVAAVGTIQSGDALTIAYMNSRNVFGITLDRMQMSGSCTNGEIIPSGSVQTKLNNYFRAACLTTPPVIGADGIGTPFGNSATGIVNGPGQANFDFSVTKTIPLRWPHEGQVQLRGNCSISLIIRNLQILTTLSTQQHSALLVERLSTQESDNLPLN